MFAELKSWSSRSDSPCWLKSVARSIANQELSLRKRVPEILCAVHAMTVPRSMCAAQEEADRRPGDRFTERMAWEGDPWPDGCGLVEAVFQQLKTAVIERALGAELGVHLSDAEGGLGNHRNGRSGKTVLTDEDRCASMCRVIAPVRSSRT